MKTIYDKIGKSYSVGRRTDPKLAKQMHQFLSGSHSILNIGAGTGSYEPANMEVIALEPSEVMISQRPKGSAPVVQGVAENLPFEDKQFSHCMTVLSMHHWTDRDKAFSEIKRVTREKFVALTWSPLGKEEPYWLYRDYLKAIPELNRSIFPNVNELRQYFAHVEEYVLPIPHDCQDGFDGAYWKRPQAFLDPEVRANMSVFSKIKNVDAILERLQQDVESGAWHKKNAGILALDELDIGYRIFVAEI